MLIGAQTGLLVLRTLLTDWIARVEGLSGSTLVSLVGGGEGGKGREGGLVGEGLIYSA